MLLATCASVRRLARCPSCHRAKPLFTEKQARAIRKKCDDAENHGGLIDTVSQCRPLSATPFPAAGVGSSEPRSNQCSGREGLRRRTPSCATTQSLRFLKLRTLTRIPHATASNHRKIGLLRLARQHDGLKTRVYPGTITPACGATSSRRPASGRLPPCRWQTRRACGPA